jgi:hypothetical protein
MDSCPLCPLVEDSTESAHDCLTLGAILRVFLPVLWHLLKLGKHKLRVLWRQSFRLSPLFTSTLGATLLR